MTYEEHITRRGRVYLNVNSVASDNHVSPDHVMTYLDLWANPEFVSVWRDHVAGALTGLALEAHLASLCPAGTRIPAELAPVKVKAEEIAGGRKLKNGEPFVWLKGLIACKLAEMQIGTKAEWEGDSQGGRSGSRP